MTTARTAVTGNAGPIPRLSGGTPNRPVARWRGAGGAKSGSAAMTRPATTLASAPTELWGRAFSLPPAPGPRPGQPGPDRHSSGIAGARRPLPTARLSQVRMATASIAKKAVMTVADLLRSLGATQVFI